MLTIRSESSMVNFVPQPAVQVLQKDVAVRTGQSPRPLSSKRGAANLFFDAIARKKA